MGRQIKQVLITYVTHKWVMVGIATWLLVFVSILIGIRASGVGATKDSISVINMYVEMPVLFLSLMLVAQVKTQFAHSRAVLTPGFTWPHAVVAAGISWNYTTWLNILFLIIAAGLLWRFQTTGGPAMLRMMNRPMAQGRHHCH